jgi:HSP20 family molecular chaperone IbpA
MAVAGFARQELDLTVQENTLLVTGQAASDNDAQERVFLHRGIAARQFQRAFVMAEGIEVTGAWLDNGLLHIDLARPPPETRVRTIRIGRKGAAGSPSPVVDGSSS